PWCREAEDFLDNSGVSYREVDVISDTEAFARMHQVSGQTKTPTLDWNGRVLSDFDTEQLRDFLHKRGVEFEDS
ncbi:MAG: glutaredoxin family protein, partial [Opitutaceae bacterium]